MSVEVRVAGKRLAGFRDGSIQLSLDAPYNSFELTYTADEKRLRCGDEVEVLVSDESVLTGYVDTTDDADEVESLRLRVSGRSKTADLADCSAAHRAFTSARLSEIAQELAEPFFVSVFIEGDEGAPFPSFVVQKGESVIEAIHRGATKRGLVPFTVGGDLVLAQAGARATSLRLVRGERPLIRSARTDSWYSRFSEYVFRGQVRPTEQTFGKKAAHLSSSVRDEGVTRYRPLLYQAETHSPGDLRAKAELERNLRAANAQTVTALVEGHTTAEGWVWRPNVLVAFRNPVLGVDETLLVQSVRIRFGEREPDSVELSLVRPASYEVLRPSPKKAK